jgi:hypothetical protein
MWNLKKYRSAVRDELCLLIAQNQLVMVVYEAQDVKVKATKEELQVSKFCVLNVLFSEDFFDDVVKMNDKNHKDELDAEKAWNRQDLWSSIYEEYNESANDELYRG